MITRLLVRYYRVIKAYLIVNEPRILTGIFFKLVSMLDRGFSQRRLTKPQILARTLWKQNYILKYNNKAPYALVCDKYIADNSDDYKFPRGAIYDSSVNVKFNLKLYQLLNYNPSIKILDLGCAGGGLVKSFLEDGITAIGVEGSNISKKLRSGEWDSCPYHLFTCDITENFSINSHVGEKVLFDVVTAWEVLEHITEKKIEPLILNIIDNLRSKGYFIGSVDKLPDANPNIGAVYHHTLKSKEWWLDKFQKFGFSEVLDHPFKTEDYVRGNGIGIKNWDPIDGTGFHLVLKKD